MVVETETSTVAPSWVTQALSWVGLRWPEGDTSAISAAGDAWIELSHTLTSQLGQANTAAAAAWSMPNWGGSIDEFRGWWGATAGPALNLSRAADAAAKIGAALKGMSWQIIALRTIFVAQLALLALALAGAGLLIVGTGGLGTIAVAATGEAAVNRARQILIRRIELTMEAILAQLILGLLRGAIQELPPAPVRTTDTDREDEPQAGPRPPPPIPPWLPDANPRCQVNPKSFLPLTTGPILIGNPDPRTKGDYILRIQQRIDGSARVVTIDGVMDKALPARARLKTPQYELQQVRPEIGIPDDTYDACHAYGPGFGSEAAAGMGLCPTTINHGEMWNLESRLRNLYQATDAQGGWVELQVTSRTFQNSAWPDPQSGLWLSKAMSMPAGTNLLNQVDYTATVCQPGQVIDQYQFGIRMDPPTIRGGIFSAPSTATIYGRLPP